MKSKKWPLAHVWSHIITLKHPKLTQFVSARRYDHEEVPEHMSGASNSHKKFFAAHKIEGDDHSNTILELPIGKIPQNGA